MLAGTSLFLPWTDRSTAAAAPIPLLDPLSVPKFENELPNPLDSQFSPDGNGVYQVGMGKTTQNILGPGFPDTTVWGYGQDGNYTYPGRTFVAQKDVPIEVQWHNNLPLEDHLLPVDESLHWCYSLDGYTDRTIEADGVPVVPHLHGGHTESASDGLPEAFFTPGFAVTGPEWVKETFEYANDQEAGTLWYHDHALGLTRLNVYAGLAGFYILRDEVDTGAVDNPLGLPHYPYEVPIVIQDRLFDVDGDLVYPTVPGEVEPGFDPLPDPSVVPEMFGDVIVVNGQAWPRLSVEPRLYRFRLLNGSDSRFYNLWVDAGGRSGDGPPLHVIGTDDGLLAAPVPVDQLVIGPGERYDVLVDFSGWEGERLVVRNNARSPFPKGGTVDPRTTGRIMAFDVGETVNNFSNNVIPDTLREGGRFVVSGDVTTRRSVALFEGTDHYGRLQPMLGTVADGSLLWDESEYPITENPELDDVEVWEVYNTTPDAHTIHLHLVTFEVLERQKIKYDLVEKEMTSHDGEPASGFFIENEKTIGQPTPAQPWEQGPKDTIIAYPDEVVRVKAKFDRPGRYVWHCHILSHEDHEMMRPYSVQAPMLAQKSRREAETRSETGGVTELSLEPNVPNPFGRRTEIRFALPEAQQVRLDVYDVQGRRVAQLVDRHLEQGRHRVGFDASGLASGLYISRLVAERGVRTGRMMLVQ